MPKDGTAFCVGSWDNLSSKASSVNAPESLVWNETQKQEAIRFTASCDRITVTGAQCFDQWFGRVPTRTRDEFCRHWACRDRPLISTSAPRYSGAAGRSQICSTRVVAFVKAPP